MSVGCLIHLKGLESLNKVTLINLNLSTVNLRPQHVPVYIYIYIYTLTQKYLHYFVLIAQAGRPQLSMIDFNVFLKVILNAIHHSIF